MNITDIRALRGPNYHSLLPVILMKLDLEDLKHQPTSSRTSLGSDLEVTLPTLYEHTGRAGIEGGFLHDVEEGVPAAILVELVALELQRLIGHDVKTSRTTALKDPGIYQLIYSYQHEKVGLKAASLAVNMVQALYDGEIVDASEYIAELRDIESGHREDQTIDPSIPICAITGTNGKTTTTRLIAHIMQTAGHRVGLTSTDHVAINGEAILKGDYSGPGGAKAVRKDPRVDMAVLEVARGGILRRGLGFPHCDVGVLLNVTSNHLGLGGIETLEELARVKSVVTESVKTTGWAVFNVDDPQTKAVVHRSQAKKLFFSKDPNHPLLRENVETGYLNVTLEDGQIVLQLPEETIPVAEINAIPLSFKGKAMFNVENAMAAVGACFALGAKIGTIREGLYSFYPSPEQSAGRMNLFDLELFHVLIDYGHNVAALAAIGDFIKAFPAKRVIRMAAAVGDRKTEDIYEFGLATAVPGDVFVLADPSPRGRPSGETAEILKKALISHGVASDDIHMAFKEADATRMALEAARAGDLVVLQVENIGQVTQAVLNFKEKIRREELNK